MPYPIHRQSGYPAVRSRYAGQAVDVPSTVPAGAMLPSQPAALGPEQGQYVKLPGVNFPPAGATPVDETGDGNIAPGASATLVTIQVPDTQRCRLARIGFGADDETATAFLSWTIVLGVDAVPGYTLRPASLGSLLYPADIFILVGSSAQINVRVTASATAAGTLRYIARVSGWLYSEREA